MGGLARWIVSSTTVASVFLCVLALSVIDVVSGGLVGVVLMQTALGGVVAGEFPRWLTASIFVLSFALSGASTGVQKALWDMVIRDRLPRGAWWAGALLLIVLVAVLDTVGDAGFGALVFASVPLGKFPDGLRQAALIPQAMTALWALVCLMGEFCLAVLLYHLADGEK